MVQHIVHTGVWRLEV